VYVLLPWIYSKKEEGRRKGEALKANQEKKTSALTSYSSPLKLRKRSLHQMMR
jgi:hypothetical protein